MLVWHRPVNDAVKQIPLTQGQVALVDAADYPWLRRYKWWAKYSQSNRTYYAYGRMGGERKMIIMSRLILGLTDPKIEADHKNGDTLDNRRKNLRRATRLQNAANHPTQRNNTSGFKGVSKHNNRFRARIRGGGKRIHLGVFDTKEAAYDAYSAKALELFGEFARLEPASIECDQSQEKQKPHQDG